MDSNDLTFIAASKNLVKAQNRYTEFVATRHLVRESFLVGFLTFTGLFFGAAGLGTAVALLSGGSPWVLGGFLLSVLLLLVAQSNQRSELSLLRPVVGMLMAMAVFLVTTLTPTALNPVAHGVLGNVATFTAYLFAIFFLISVLVGVLGRAFVVCYTRLPFSALVYPDDHVGELGSRVHDAIADDLGVVKSAVRPNEGNVLSGEYVKDGRSYVYELSRSGNLRYRSV